MSVPTLYLLVAMAALLVALWLALQITGALFKLLFLAAIIVVGVFAVRSWAAASGR